MKTSSPKSLISRRSAPGGRHWRVMLALAAVFGFAQLAGATTYTWNATNGNWSMMTNWVANTGAGGPLPTDSAVFGGTDTTSGPTITNNTVDLGFDGAISNLTYNSSSTAAAGLIYNVTQIPAGQTLSVGNNLIVGNVNGVSSAIVTEAYMFGGGTLLVTGTNLMVQNYDNTTRAGATAYFNMSGLTNFIYQNTNGAIRVEDRLPSDSTDTGLGGNISLAAVSNSITALTLNLGTSSSAQAGAAGSMTLGAGTNLINASTINISAQKSTFSVLNTGGGLRIRGISGADSDSAVNISIGNKNVGGGSGTITGSMLLNGSAVDIKAGTLIVGANTGGTPNSSGDSGVGMLQFDTGTISANTVIMADNTSANSSSPASCVGTIDVGANATLLIGAGQVFDLASETSSGQSTGNLIISNGLVNCQGPISMGPNAAGNSTGNITFLTGGTLNMGPGSYVGAVTNPITTLTLTNCTLSVSIPSVNYTNICVGTLNWPTPDTNLTISVAAMPAGINPGAVFPFLNFANTMNGTFTSPNLSLPPGVLGNLSLAPGGNTMYLTITAGVGPGTGGVNQLANPSFETPGGADWTATGAATVVTTNGVNTYPNTGGCTVDTRPIQALSGTNAAKLTGSFVAGGSTNSWSQSVPVAAGATLTAGGFTYMAHEDIMSGADSFYYELDFKNTNGALLAAYQSATVSNLTCGGPNIIPLDAWALMAITNQMQISGGLNTGVVVSNVTGGVILAPPQTVAAQFKAVFIQRNATDSGSVYFDGPNLGLLAGPVPPVMSAVTPNLITLCTNTALSCTVTSAVTTISSVKIIAQTTTLGGLTKNTATYTAGSPGLTVTGIGTPAVAISLALATNTIYPSVIVQATDADGITVSSTNSFDTLVPALVIEAADFNYNSGQFIDTPPNGGLALYQGQVGTGGVDENKAARSSTQSYYRPSDAVIIQAAAPNTGTPPTATEQKFVTAANNGDTTDIEVEVGYNTPGDWLNYSRTFGSSGSAPSGTYNVWAYLATSGTGVQSTFSQVTSDPTQGSQTTNFLGYFGTSSFSDNGYNNYRYVPLVDQYGNPVSLTISNGVQTFKSTVVGNPNLGFYMLVPVAPVYTPVLQHVSPNGATPYESSGQLSFTVGPANGTAISTNGIQLIVNGGIVTSGISYSQLQGSWTGNYAIQSNQLYTITINVTNQAGLSSSYTESFDTFSTNNFTWEAVDYDFTTNDVNGVAYSGLFIDNPVPTCDITGAGQGTFATNSYFGYPEGLIGQSIALQGVDINWADPQTGAAQWYRNDGVGSEVTTDYLRPKFVAAQQTDPNVGEFDLGYLNGGNWVNYTRTYPTNYYNVWGRLAGGNGPFSGSTLSLVTSGVGTSNQTVQVLGSFADATAAGWQVWHWIPLLDTNGNPVLIQLGGKATIRFTSGANLNAEFFMLAPTSPPAVSFSISIADVAGVLQISIPTVNGHTYTLWQASSLTGTWTQVGGSIPGDGAVHVINQPASGSQGYYRVLAQ